MELLTAIKGMQDARVKLATDEGVNDPDVLSQEMSRLAQYTAIAENYLAEYERDYEIDQAKKLHTYLVVEGASATNAEKRVKIDLAEQKAQITYLSRIIASAWKQVGVAQSRWNHIAKGGAGQI